MQFSQPDMQQQQFENTSDLEDSQGERNIKKKTNYGCEERELCSW